MKKKKEKIPALLFGLSLSATLAINGVPANAQGLSNNDFIPSTDSNDQGNVSPKKASNAKEAKQNVSDSKENMTAKKNIYENKLKAKEIVDEKLKAANADNQRAVAERQEKEKNLEKAISGIQNEYKISKEQIQQKLDEARAEFEKAREKFSIQQDLFDKALEDKNAAQKKYDEILAKNPQVEAELADAKKEVANADADLKSAKEKLENATANRKSAETAKNSAQAELSNAMSKKVDADKTLQDAESKLEKAKLDAESAQKKVDELQAELNKEPDKELVKQLSDLTNTLIPQAKTELSHAKERLASVEKEVANLDALAKSADKELQNAKTQEETARNDVSNKEALLKEAESKLYHANADLQKASQEKAKADEDVKAVELSLVLAKTQEEDAKIIVENLSKSLEEAKAAEANAKSELENNITKQKAKEQWNKGAMGFYESNNSNYAVDVFKTDKKASDGTSLLDATKNAGENNAASLDNMKRALEQIKKINEKRQKDKGIDGRNLDVLSISDFDMAVAQVDANWSAYKFAHAKVYGTGENLAWNSSSDVNTSISHWWDKEKAVFDDLRNNKNLKTAEEMQKYINEHPEYNVNNVRQIGHYLNFVDDFYFGSTVSYYHYTNKYLGYAFRPGQYGYVHAMELGQSAQGYSAPIDEYIAKFNEYYNDLKSKMEKDDPDAQKKYDDAKEKREKLEEELDVNQGYHAQSTTNVTKIEKELEDFKKEQSTSLSKLSVAEKALLSATANKTKVEDDLNTAKTDLVKAGEEVSKKETAASDANGKLSAKTAEKALAENNVKSHQAGLTDLENEKADLEKRFSKPEISSNLELAKKELKEKTDIQKSAKSDKKQAEKSALDAQNSINELQEKVNSKTADLENAKQAENKTQEAVSQKEQVLKEKEDANQKLQEKYKELNEAKSALDKITSDFKDTTKVLDDLQDKAEALSTSVIDLEQELAQKEKNYKETLAINPDDETTYKSFDQVTKAKQELENAKSKEALAKAALDEVKKNVEEAEKEVSLANREYLNAQVDYQMALAELDKYRSVLKIYPSGGTWADGSSNPIEINNLYIGDSFIVPNAPIRDGYTFLYWQGSIYHPGDVYEAKDSMHSLTAVWKKNDTNSPKNLDKSNSKDSKIQNSKAKSPKTGDDSNMLVLFGGELVTLATFIALLREKTVK